MTEEGYNDYSGDCQSCDEEESSTRNQIKELRKENIFLKNQLKDVFTYPQRIKDLQEENTALKSSLKQEKRAREEMKHRLDLVAGSAKEAEEMNARQRKASNDQRNADIQQTNMRIKEIEEKHTEELLMYSEQIDALMKEREQAEVQEKTLNFKLTKLLKAAQRHFNCGVATVDDLIQHLSQPKKDENVEAEKAKLEEQMKINEEEVNKYKKRAKEARIKAEELQRDLTNAKRDYKQMQQTMEKKVKCLNKEINEMNKENEKKEQKNKNLIDSLKTDNMNLKEEVSKSKAVAYGPLYDLTPIQQEKSETKPQEVVEEKKKEDEKDNNQNQVTLLKETIYDLNDKINDLESENKALQADVSNKNEEVSYYKLENSKCANEYNTLLIKYNMLVAESNSIKDQQSAIRREAQPVESSPKKECKENTQECAKPSQEEKYKKALDSTKKKYKSVKSQLEDTHNEMMKQEEKIEDQRREINLLKDNVDQLESSLATANQEITLMIHQKETEKPVTAETLLPESCFTVASAEPELAQQIQPIASNASLQPVSKVQNIYSIIINYYSNLLQEKAEEITAMDEDRENVRNLINQFFVDCSIIVSGEGFTFEQFFDESAGQKFIEDLTELHHEYETLKFDNEKSDKFFEVFADYFGESEDRMQKLDDVKKLLDATIKQSETRKQNYLKLKKAIKELQTLSENSILDLQQEKKSLEEEIENLNDEIEKLNKKCKEADEENERITNEYKEEKEQIEALHNELIGTQEMKMNEMTELNTKEYEQKQKELQQINQKNKEHQDKIEDLTYNLQEANQNIEYLNEENQKLNDKIQEIIAENSEKSKQLLDNENKEKQNIYNSLSKQVTNLQYNNQALSMELNDLTNKFNELEMNYNEANSQCDNSHKKIAKLCKKIKGLKEQHLREKQLKTAEFTVKLSEAESSYQQKLDDERNKAADEKQKIYTYLVDQFSEFYSDAHEINDASFRSTVQKVREVLCRVSQSDIAIRKMVDATDGQPTEDAVAQLLME